VELLLAGKADVNGKASNGVTPLHLAAFNGNKDVAELLLANHADVNAKDNHGWTPLH
jgi:ankyrin repeat protein